MISLEQRMADTAGRSTGFDYMRMVLATAVILWHSFAVSYGSDFVQAVLASPARPLIVCVLPMFFALSGFLVAGSLFRNSAISTFVGLRVIRIAPALTVEVVLSALTLGPLLTTLPLGDYFSSPVFAQYFLNITGHIHYHLPGLFLDNPIPNIVNGQLWTVPWELKCYLALTLLTVLRIVRRRDLLLAITIVGMLAILVRQSLFSYGRLYQSHGGAGTALLTSFLAAVSIYTYRDKIPWNGRLCTVSLASVAGLLLVSGGDFLVGFPAAYATIYLGLLNPRKIKLLQGADYSYGLFLYGYVIQQAVTQLLPGGRHWYVNFPLTMLFASGFAALSWHCVEKPALRLRVFLPKIEAWFAAWRRSKPKALAPVQQSLPLGSGPPDGGTKLRRT